MNPSHESEERDDDALLESLLSPLKRIEPPPTARSEFRAAVAGERRGLAPPLRTRAAWWRRSIEVPVPVALAAMLLLLVSGAWTLRAPPVGDPPVEQPRATSPVPDGNAVSRPEAVARATDSQSPEREYYSTEIYVCGVGRISSVSGYTIREENHVP